MATITTNLAEAIAALQSEHIVAIPTETVYGLAANAASKKAIEKVFLLKQRPFNHPLILHVADQTCLSRYVAFIPDYAKTLMDTFWPGPLTLVFQAKPFANAGLITANQTTVAIRCPAHPLTQSLLSQLDFPLVAPSANPYTKISPTTAQHVQQSFQDAELLILDGGRCALGLESSIISVVDPKYYQILREGHINDAALALQGFEKDINQQTSIQVPGKMKDHYQPQKTLYAYPFGQTEKLEHFIKNQGDNVYSLAFNPPKIKLAEAYLWPADPKLMAYELYYQLRIADASKATCLITELPPLETQWAAIYERLIKASKLL